MKDALVLYHDDLDGKASAAIVQFIYSPMGVGVDMIPYTYGEDTLDDNKLAEEYAIIFIVDMCLRPFSRMAELAKKTKVVWIDHHFGSIQEYEKDPCDFHGLLLGKEDNKKAACELTWEYFFAKTNTPAPRGILEISKVDTWNHNDNETTWAFFEWADFNLSDPKNPDWVDVFTDTGFHGTSMVGVDAYSAFFGKCIEDGRKLRKYREFKEIYHAQQNAMDVTFEGYPCVALNSNSFGSSQFNSVYDAEKHKMMIRFSRAIGYWKFSIYTTHDDIDLSKIANKYGGGGHKAASGFEVHDNVIPFELG